VVEDRGNKVMTDFDGNYAEADDGDGDVYDDDDDARCS
jgi:hypothetical protein